MRDLILKIYEYAARLKEIKRTGWVQRGVEEAESVASHSYAVALLSMILAELRGLDALDAVRMAMIHDLPESVIGDLTPEMKAGIKDLDERVERFLGEMLSLMPKNLSNTYREAWRRLSSGQDDVARLVRDVDRLERGLQAIRYLREGFRDAEEIYRSSLNEIGDPELRRILEEAYKRT